MDRFSSNTKSYFHYQREEPFGILWRAQST